MSRSLEEVISPTGEGRPNIWFDTSWIQKYLILVAVAIALQLIVPLDTVTAYDIAIAPLTALIWLGAGALIWQGYVRARGSEPNPIVTKWARPAIVISSIALIGLLSGAEVMGGAAGTAIILAIVWAVIKGRKPGWTSGWSGAWLFISGLFIAWSVGLQTSQNAIAVGFMFGTIIVAPPMVVWKVFGILSWAPNGGERKSDANDVEDGH